MECNFKINGNIVNSKYVLILAFLVFLSGCSVTNTVRKHPKYFELVSLINTVHIIPPEIVITRKFISKSDVRVGAKELQMKQVIAKEISAYLRKQGVELSDTDFYDAFGDTADLTLEQLRSAHGKVSSYFHNKVSIGSYKGFTRSEKDSSGVKLGSVASYIAKQLNVDALLIVRYIGFEIKTDGVSMDLLDSSLSSRITEPFADAATYGGLYEIALVDAGSGDVIWINSNVQVANPGQKQQDWAEVTRKLLQKLKFDKKVKVTPVVAVLKKS